VANKAGEIHVQGLQSRRHNERETHPVYKLDVSENEGEDTLYNG
jgi:hypothetical protein